MLVQFGHFGADYKLAVWLVLILFVKILVHLFRRVEFFARHDLGDYRRGKSFAGRQAFYKLLGLLFLRRTMKKNDRPVLLPNIIALPVKCRRIVSAKKYIQ